MPWTNETQQQFNWDASGDQQSPKQKPKPAGRTRPYAVADVHEWHERSTGKIFRLTIGEMMKRERVGYSTVKGWIEGAVRRRHMCPASKASRSALMLGERLRKYDWLGKTGRTIEGDFLGWMLANPIKCGGGKVVQDAGKKLTKLADNIVIIMARYQVGIGRYNAGVGIKALAKDYGSSSFGALTQLLREGGVDTTKRANHARLAGRCIRAQLKERNARMIEAPEGKLRARVMNRIQSAMKSQSVNAAGSFRHVGCTAEFLRAHIESQWQAGMTWENYGQWHIDHARPCASFDLSDPAQFAECFNWKNLQPLWALDNIKKGATYAALCA